MELGLEAIVGSCGARTSPPSCASARAERQRRLPGYSVVMLKAQGHDATRESIAIDLYPAARGQGPLPSVSGNKVARRESWPPTRRLKIYIFRRPSQCEGKPDAAKLNVRKNAVAHLGQTVSALGCYTFAGNRSSAERSVN